MTIHKTAYDTTQCAGLILTDVEEKLKEAIITGQVSYNEFGIFEIASSGAFADKIPAFAHPYVVWDDHRPQVCLDARPYRRPSSSSGSSTIHDVMGYELAMIRARLNKVWVGDYNQGLLGFSPVPVMLYSNTIADAISRKFNLDMVNHYTIQILASVYYYTLFDENADTTDKNYIVKIATQLYRATGLDSARVREALERLAAHDIKLTSIDSLCDAIKKLIDNPRTRDLNFVTLATALGGQWWGPEGRPLVNVALEHPPTWLALIFSAYNDNSYKRTGLGTALQGSFYKKRSQQYIGAINNLTR